jgi:hypothetical protein
MQIVLLTNSVIEMNRFVYLVQIALQIKTVLIQNDVIKETVSLQVAEMMMSVMLNLHAQQDAVFHLSSVAIPMIV